MESLEEEDDERYRKQFAKYLADEVSAEDLEEVYAEAHKQIRESPEAKKKDYSSEQLGKFKSASQEKRHKKLTYDERKKRVEEKISAFRSGEIEA